MRTTFRGQSSSHVLTLTSQDSNIFPAFGPPAPGPPNCPLLTLIGATYRRECIYSRTELLEAAVVFRDAIEQQRDFLGYRYLIESILPGQEVPVRGNGGAGGFRIEGRFHSIWGGAGTCYLKEYAVEPDGTVREVRTIDVRDRQQVETDDWGPIRIYRRKLKITLFDTVPSLVSFLENSPDRRLKVTTSG